MKLILNKIKLRMPFMLLSKMKSKGTLFFLSGCTSMQVKSITKKTWIYLFVLINYSLICCVTVNKTVEVNFLLINI